VPETVTIPRRFCGPANSANGGYACGVVAGLVGGPAECTLRAPPPLDVALAVERGGDGKIQLRQGELLVAEGVPAVVEVDVPAPIDFATAVIAGGLGSSPTPVSRYMDRTARPDARVEIERVCDAASSDEVETLPAECSSDEDSKVGSPCVGSPEMPFVLPGKTSDHGAWHLSIPLSVTVQYCWVSNPIGALEGPGVRLGQPDGAYPGAVKPLFERCSYSSRTFTINWR